MLKNITVDDLCSACKFCQYKPKALSECIKLWPHTKGPPHQVYITQCPTYKPATIYGENIPTHERYKGS